MLRIPWQTGLDTTISLRSTQATTICDLFQENLAVSGSGTKLVTDAHIAALAMEHSAELHTNDSDFARFPGLRWRNPLT